MRRHQLLLGVLLAVTGCGGTEEDLAPPSTSPPSPTTPPASTPPSTTPPVTPPPTPPATPMSVDDAKVSVEAALEASHQVRTALELLGLVPDYTCGEPRSVFLSRVALELSQEIDCATLSLEPEGTTGDALVLRFDEGCRVEGRTVEGEARFVFRGGEQRMEVEADLRRLVVDEEPLSARVGYGTCGDEKRVWATAAGTLPRRPDVSFQVDVRVGLRESSLPLIGGTTLVLDGTAQLRRGQAVDAVHFEALEYEVGGYLPKSGGLTVEASDGHVVSARFSSVLWKLGKAHLSVDGGPEVTVPIVH
ncbi:MAG: hypothetical protein AB1938_24425 [Myxococcota bacterium]